MPKQVLIESRNQTIDFPDDATQEEIDQYIAQEFPRTGEDVAYDLSKYTNAADLRDFIAAIPDEDYIKLNNYRADKKLSWGELAGIAGDAVGTIVGDALSGVKNAVTKAGEGVIESAARGVGAGTIDLVTLGQKLVTPNERIPTLEEFLQTTKDKPAETIADETFPFSFGRKQVPNTEADYSALIQRERFNELQALDLAEASEKLIQGAPVPEVAKGASYLDAIALAGLAKSIAKAGVKTIYKKAATAAVPSPTPAAAFTTVEQGGTFITAGIRKNAENFASKVGEGAAKAGFTGVEFGAKGVKTAADLGKGIIDVANELGLKNAAVRGAIAAGIGYKEGGNDQAMLYGILGTALPVAARKGLAFTSGAADFIGAAAKVRKSGPARAGWLERMASSADISPEARAVAEKALFVQPFTQLASDTVKKAAKNALLGATVGTALGYAADGEQGAAAGFGSGLAIGTLSGPLDAGIDAIKTLAGQSTSRTRANAAADIRSFVNSIADDQARTAYAEVMNKAIEVAGPERAADMLDNLRLAEAMGATVEVVPVGKRKEAFNAFQQKGPAGGTITINPDRMTAGTVSHETFHQLLNVGLKAELQKALSDVYLPKVDEAGNVIRPGLFSDAELAKKAEQLAARYANNPRGYKQSLEYAETLNNQAGRTPEEINEARMFLIDEMTAEYAESFMGRSRPGVFNPDRLPLWHRQILQGIDDMVLNKITDKVYGNKNIKDPTAAFVDEQGKPIRVPQLDAVLKRAFSNKMNRSRGTSAKPKEIVIPTNPRDLVAWASTFGSTRDVIKQDENGKPAILTKEEQKTITAADFEEAKTVYQALPPEAKQTVLVTNKAGSPIDINNKGARIQITSKTPEDVFNAFLEAAKKRGMGNQQLANMRQFYASMIAEDGPTFNTVNNPVYEYNKKTGTMKATVRPPTRQEIYPTAITINSAGGFNVDYIDLSRVKANAEKIIENPKYRGVWPDVDGFMADFGRSLKNLSLGETDAKATAELLGNGDAKMGALKRDLIAEAMNVTLPKRLKDKGYVNEPTIDPLTLFTNEGKERRIGGSAFRDFRIERLTEVTPTNERLKMVKENAYDLLVQRFQPDAFARETLPAGETLTNPDGYRILKKTGSKLYRVYDDQGELIGTTSTEKAAMRKGQDDFAKKASQDERQTEQPLQPSSTESTDIRFQPAPADSILIPNQALDKETIPLYQKTEKGIPVFDKKKPKIVKMDYNLLNKEMLFNFKGQAQDLSLVSENQFPYEISKQAIKDINDAIKSGIVDSLVNKIVAETKTMLTDTTIAAGRGWYSRMRVALKKAYGDFSEVFAQLLGATSAQTPVDQNFLQAVEAAELIKDGSFDRHRKEYLTMRAAEEKGTLKQLIFDRNLVGSIRSELQRLTPILKQVKSKVDRESLETTILQLKELIDKPSDNWSDADMRNIFILGEDILPRRKNGKKFNANSGAVLAVIGGDWLQTVKAPKTPNFAGNLTGRTLEATIDVWAARFMRRMIYGDRGIPWRIQYAAEKGVSDKDFAFSQVVLKRAARKLDMNPDDLQAVLWFGEKDIYGKNNWTSSEGKKKSSFDEMFYMFFPKGGKPRTYSEVIKLLGKVED